MIRVIIADDDQILRAGLRLILQSQEDIRVIAEAESGAAAIRACTGSQVDVVLMDVRMPDMDGIEATRRLSVGPDPVRVLVLTTFDHDEDMFAAVRAGASGFLLKRSTPEELITAVRAVAAGEGLISSQVTRRLLAEFAASTPAPPTPQVRQRLARLTDREREVLILLARGHSNQEISGLLHIGEATTKSHVRSILDKLDLRDRIQAVVFAFDQGLVRPGTT